MITTTKNKISYVSDGTATTYSFDFPAIEPEDIQVFVYDLNNNKTQLIYGTDYNVTLNSDNSGGIVTLTNPANKNYTILIYREVPYTQETVYTENSPFPAQSHEKALDKLTLLSQQLQEKFDRTLQYDPADEGQSVTLPPMIGGGFLGTTADKKLTWKANIDYSNINLKVNTIKDLLNVDLTNWDGVQPFVVLVLGYHESNDGGGGIFYWDANEDKTNHNGGTIIDPTKTFPSDWSDTTQQDDWFNTTNTGSGCWKRVYDGKVHIDWFGSKGDSISDDTKPLQKVFSVALSVLGDVNKTYTYKGDNTPIISYVNYIKDVNLKLLSNCRFLDLKTTNSIYIENIRVIGNRGNEVEQWDKFSEMYNIPSIQPHIGYFITNSNYLDSDKTITVRNCYFKDIFNSSVIVIYSNGGTVKLDNIYFKNCANKNYEVFFQEQGVGNCYATNITTIDCGKLPSTFNYYDGSTVTTVNFGDSNMPLPQGAYLNVITYGNAFYNNIYVKNYASTAITANINGKAILNNIEVISDDVNFCSNNPSGAIWDEACNQFELNNTIINIKQRSSLDVGDNSALEIYVSDTSKNERRIINNVIINVEDPANLSKTIRISSRGNSILEFNNVEITNTSNNVGIDFFHGYMSTATIKDKIYLNNFSLNGRKIRIEPVDTLYINNSNINTIQTDQYIIHNIDIPGIDKIVENIKVSNSFINISGGFGQYGSVNWSCNNMSIDNSYIKGDLVAGVASKFTKKFFVNNSLINGRIIIPNNSYTQISNSIIYRRIEIEVSNVIIITGSTIGNDEETYTIWFNGVTPKSAIVTGNNIFIKSGVVGAGYINAPSNLIDANNAKMTINYDFS